MARRRTNRICKDYRKLLQLKMVKLKEIIEERRIVTAIDLYLKKIYGANKYYNCEGPAHEVSNAIKSSY